MNGLSKAVRVRTAGLVVRNGKLLLIEHEKNGRKYWLVPGGGVDFGESVIDALVREMKEELALDVVPVDLVFSCDSIDPSGQRHVLNLFFSCSENGDAMTLGDDPRLCDFGFFSADEIASMTVFPPCSAKLISFLNGEKMPVYVGSIWEE
jgi:ADP-ribose pyrophosphatase YjhB (NUDIX family)